MSHKSTNPNVHSSSASPSLSVDQPFRRDFGINLRDLTRSEGPRSIRSLGLMSAFKGLGRLKTASFTRLILFSFRRFISFSARLKKSLTRSIFLGRGVYFKYVSNLALVVIVSFGAFVYLSYERSSADFISKYSGVSVSNSAILYNPGWQAFIAQKQFRVTQYTVQPGDTLASIAAKYSSDGNVITVDSILWANNLTPSSVLVPGMKLDIPPVSGVLHTVKKGDTVISIAKTYKLLPDNFSAEQLAGVTQQITDVNYLNVRVVQVGDKEERVPELVEGQRIIVPGGFKPAPVVVAVASRPKPPTTVNKPPATIDGPSGSLGWPVEGGVGVITQGWKSWHPAVDVADPRGPNLVAMDSGYIVSFGYMPVCASYVIMSYDSGYEVLYCHLSAFATGLKAGLPISRGQVVGRMGCTGVCTGTHVHVQIRSKKNRKLQNPCLFDVFRGKGDCR